MTDLLDNPYAAPSAEPPEEAQPAEDGMLAPGGRRKAVPWSGWDVLVIFLMMLALQVVARGVVEAVAGGTNPPAGKTALRLASAAPSSVAEKPATEDPIDPDKMLLILVANAVASLAGLAIAIAWLRSRCHATWGDLGFSPHRLPRDVVLGVVGFLIVMAPIYGLTAVLRLLFPEQPQHPIVTLLTQRPGILPLLLCGFTAVALAPVVEEFLCRGVFQGWLERLAVEQWDRSHRYGLLPPVWAVVLPSPQRPRVMLGPILISATLFAFLHFSHGIDPYPLFVLALALGYLYQRTGRLWPSIVLHATLNAVSLVVLWVGI